MTKIYLIRHAEAEGNLYRRAHGHFNGGITERGHKQIYQLKKRFESEDIDVVMSSDLKRARTTAEAIYKPKEIPLITDKRLREAGLGIWEDMPWGEIEYSYPDQCEYFNSDPALWKVEGSEEYSGVKLRMTECLDEIAQEYEGKTVAVFSHGFAIRGFLCGIYGIESHETSKVPYCDNTAASLIIYDNKVITAEYHGDNTHLSGTISTFANQEWWRGGDARRRENMRYLAFDKSRDSELLESINNEMSVGLLGDVTQTAATGELNAGLLSIDTQRESKIGWITQMYIKPELRRRGLGVQLIGQICNICRLHGLSKLRAEVEGHSVRFLLKYGFSELEKDSNSKYIMEKEIMVGDE